MMAYGLSCGKWVLGVGVFSTHGQVYIYHFWQKNKCQNLLSSSGALYNSTIYIVYAQGLHANIYLAFANANSLGAAI